MNNFVIVGFGEIAQKAHRPAIDDRRDCKLVAVVDLVTSKTGIPTYKTLAEALRDHPQINAASVCTPPRWTLSYAFEAVSLGLNVLLEKPPGDYKRLPDLLHKASEKKVTVYTAYHSTAPPGIHHIQDWVSKHTITAVEFEWKESVRKWHPNQKWITTREGMGVLDILFNPISLLVYVLPGRVQFKSAILVKPSNWDAPISGSLQMQCGNAPISSTFAWNYEPSSGPQEIWTIVFKAGSSSLKLTDGGAQVYINNSRVTTRPTEDYKIGPEYVNLYRNFMDLIKRKSSYTDACTPHLIEEIWDKGNWTDSGAYNIMACRDKFF